MNTLKHTHRSGSKTPKVKSNNFNPKKGSVPANTTFSATSKRKA